MATKTSNVGGRPTGDDPAAYTNFRKWSYRRWAWEFLRRNPRFKTACIEAGDDPVRQASVAQEFHLKRYKFYRESYSNGSGRPLFLSSAIASWSCAADEEARKLKLTLRGGEVLIRFDLSTTTSDAEAIEAQLRSAALVIRRRQKTYLSAKALPEPARSSAKAIYFLRSLRLLDLLDGKLGREPGRALRIVNESAMKTMSDAEARESGRKQIQQARELSVDGYRHLANRPGSPNPKTFVSAD